MTIVALMLPSLRRRMGGLTTLLCGVFLCAATSLAKQPTIEETGPRVFPVEVRYLNHRRYFAVPQFETWRDKGDHLEFDGYVYPGEWKYMEPDIASGDDPYFYRCRDGDAHTERLSLNEET